MEVQFGESTHQNLNSTRERERDFYHIFGVLFYYIFYVQHTLPYFLAEGAAGNFELARTS